VRARASRLALVTGANRGIGLAIATGLAELGYHVLLAARRAEDARAAVDGLAPRANLRLTPLQLDVADSASVRAAAEEVRDRFDRLDALVNNAAADYDDEQVPSTADLDLARHALEVNLLGAWRTCQALLPLLRQSAAGRIVNVSSGSGAFDETSDGFAPAYSVSKAGLNMLTLKLALELKGTGILVNAACPGWVRTRMGGSSAPRSPEQGADTPIWLATLPDNGPTGGFFRDRQPIPW
jgi:NAD(P)-dependent dehydrogenase (short-subunit alcohol dehydrogenase family)